MRIRYFSICLLAVLLPLATPGRAAICEAPACTKIINNGADSSKRVMVVMGDGYTSSEQSDYNAQVNSMVTAGMFGNDFFADHQNAFNVYRLNLVSAQSGISQREYDLNGTPDEGGDDTVVNTTYKNTALKYIYSGVWAQCWLEHRISGGNNLTNAAKNAALAASGLSHAQYVVVILNHSGFGGCNRGPRDIVQTKAVSWQVLAHEAGHGIGGLRDEYSISGNYSGSAVNNRNCSTVLNKNQIFWNRFVDSATAFPTSFDSATMDPNRTVGAFPGCSTKTSGIYRPVHNCRMKGNTPNFGPVCQTLMRKDLYATLDHDFENVYAGDFNGDGRDDVLVHNGNDLAIYRSSGGAKHELEQVWTGNNIVRTSSGGMGWNLSAGDKFFIADFDGDGNDDAYVYNPKSWTKRWVGMLRSNGTGLETSARYHTTLSGYGYIGQKDQFIVADFNADGKDDLFLFSASSWSKPYLGLLRSTGTGLVGAKRYDDAIPGWQMKAGDQYHVGDFNADGKDDLFVFNGSDWGPKYLGMLSAGPNTLSRTKLYVDKLASGWNMAAGDVHLVGDINGDGRDELYVFNGSNWSKAYLELTRSSGSSLDYVKRYDNDASTEWAPNIPGWSLSKGDRLQISDANNDGRSDLFVFNPRVNWSKDYLGTLMSSGSALAGSWSADWVSGIAGAGAWNLDKVDSIIPLSFDGQSGKSDMIIHNKEWLGMIRRVSSGFQMERHYHRWIYSPLHDHKPWQINMP